MQLGGRLTVLRHILKKKDMSNSGLVNKNEFEKALEQTGNPTFFGHTLKLYFPCCYFKTYTNTRSCKEYD